MATTKTTNTTSNPASFAKSMAELMASAKPKMASLQKGEIIQGRVTKLTAAEILVDINAKTEAVVLEKDKKILRTILANCKVGDTVSASVLNPESDMGHPVISLRRFVDDLLWGNMARQQASQEQVNVMVSASTRGGYLVSTAEGISGFLPNSQTTTLENQQDITNTTIGCYVLELNRPSRKVIFSQKKVMNTDEFDQVTKSLKKDQKISVLVSHVIPFGIFVSVPVSDTVRLDGLIHISEISWDKVDNIEERFTVGQSVEAVVIGVDKEAKRIDLSIRRLTEDPFTKVMKKFAVDQKVNGIVSKLTSSGVSVTVDAGDSGEIEAFISKDKIPPTVIYEVGSKVVGTITEIDPKRHRIVLTPVLKEKPIGYR